MQLLYELTAQVLDDSCLLEVLEKELGQIVIISKNTVTEYEYEIDGTRNRNNNYVNIKEYSHSNYSCQFLLQSHKDEMDCRLEEIINEEELPEFPGQLLERLGFRQQNKSEEFIQHTYEIKFMKCKIHVNQYKDKKKTLVIELLDQDVNRIVTLGDVIKQLLIQYGITN